MKNIILITIALSWAAAAFAESAGQPMPSFITLDSPCDLAASELLLRESLRMATIAGQSAQLPPQVLADATYRAKLGTHETRRLLQNCYTTESNYQTSAMLNRGTASADTYYAYEGAKGQLAAAGAVIMRVPFEGESPFDSELNNTIMVEYRRELATLKAAPKLFNVKALHDRLREEYAEIVQDSVSCRQRHRATLSRDCQSVTERPAKFRTTLAGYRTKVEPKVAKLDQKLTEIAKGETDTIAAMQTAQSQRGVSIYWSGVVAGWIGWWAYCKGWWWGQHYNYLGAGYYYASIGWWGSAWWCWGVANYCLYVHNGCLQAYLDSIALYNQINTDIKNLDTRIVNLEQSMMRLTQEKETTKGRIVAQPAHADVTLGAL